METKPLKSIKFNRDNSGNVEIFYVTKNGATGYRNLVNKTNLKDLFPNIKDYDFISNNEIHIIGKNTKISLNNFIL